MKNKFGFIPIVLPVLVMVLIIGLINMTGPQGAQAHEADPHGAAHPDVELTFTALNSAGDNLNGGVRLADGEFDANSPSVTIDLVEIGEDVTYNITPGLVFSSDAAQVRVTHTDSDENITINEIRVPNGETGLRFALSEGTHQMRIVGEDLTSPGTTGPETLYLLTYVKEVSGPPALQSSDLEDASYYFQVGVAICDDDQTPCAQDAPITDFPLFPPIRSGTGNGDPVYTLVGIGVNGDEKDLPGGMTFHPPAVNGTDVPNAEDESTRSDGWGHLTGTPTLDNARSQDVHTMEFRVVDSDTDMSASDMVAIRFTITVGRNPDPTPGPGVTDEMDEPGPGQPNSIDILYTPVSEGEGTTPTTTALVANDGTVGFRQDVTSYRAYIPTDVVTADLRVVVATTTTSATANAAIVSVIENNTAQCGGADPCYRWNGRRIDAGSANEYVILVTSKNDDGDDVTGRYEVDIRRELNTKPAFAPADNNAMDLHYYSGIVVGGDMAELPAVDLPLAASGTGNGDTSTLIYSLEDKNELSRGDNPANFLGLVYSGGNSLPGETPGDTTTAPQSAPMPMLAGTTRPELTGARDADVSSVFASYTARDRDLNITAGDESSIDVNIHVYRDVTLASYQVNFAADGTGGEGPASLDTSTRMFDTSEDYKEQSYRWDDDDISSYTYYVSHTLATTSFMVTANDADNTQVSITPPGGTKMASTTVPLTLEIGDNEVTVEVTNGAVMATHVINIRRPGLTAETLTVSYYENDGGFLYAADDMDAQVELKDADEMEYDHENYGPYMGKVPVDVNSVRVGAEPLVDGAEVAVNDFKVNGGTGYRVVDLAFGNNRIEVAVVDGPVSESYVLMIEREANSQPAFVGTQSDIRVKADVPMATVTLPMAMGGNGDLTYSLNEDELPEDVSYDTTTRTLSGTPTLDEGFESDFDLVYTVMDDDSYTGAADEAEITFTITVTYGEVAGPPGSTTTPAGQYPNGEGAATLHDIDVTYTQMRGTPAAEVERAARLDPEFDPQTADYSVIVPHDNTGVNVQVTRTERDAKVTINNTRIDRGEKTILPPTATIRVEHGTSSMTYTLTITEGGDDTPSFTATVDDMTFPIGSSIAPVELPDATGGNGDKTYRLYSEHDKTETGPDIVPDGLAFNASTRMLTGRPRLRDDAYRTVYQMVYMAMDEDGSSTTDEFQITICDPDSEFITGDCEATGGTTPVDPEPMPVTMLTAMRSADGMSVDLEWPEVMGASRIAVIAVRLPDYNINTTDHFMLLGGDATEAMLSNLETDMMYAFVVVDGSATAWNFSDMQIVVEDGN